MRPSFSLLLTLLALGSTPGLAEETLSITRHQFQLYRDYQGALKDARVQKMKPKDRLAAIARNFRVKEKELRQAIAAGDREGSQVEPVETAALKGAFKGTPLEGQMGELRVDAHEGHVVGYIQWFNTDPSKLDQEACWAASRAVKAAPLVGTFDLYASDSKARDKKVYTALIGADRAVNIHEDQIVDFAQTRYVRLFEKRQVMAAQP